MKDGGAKLTAEVDYLQINPQLISNGARPLFLFVQIGTSQAHEKSMDVMVLQEKQGTGGGIHSAAHGNANLFCVHRNLCILYCLLGNPGIIWYDSFFVLRLIIPCPQAMYGPVSRALCFLTF